MCEIHPPITFGGFYCCSGTQLATKFDQVFDVKHAGPLYELDILQALGAWHMLWLYLANLLKALRRSRLRLEFTAFFSTTWIYPAKKKSSNK